MTLTTERRTRSCQAPRFTAPTGPDAPGRFDASATVVHRLALLAALGVLASSCPITPVPPDEPEPDPFGGAAVACVDVLDQCGAERFDCDNNPGDLIGMTAALSEACGPELAVLYQCGVDNDCVLAGPCDTEDTELLDCARAACRDDAGLDGCSTGGEGEGEGEGECDSVYNFDSVGGDGEFFITEATWADTGDGYLAIYITVSGRFGLGSQGNFSGRVIFSGDFNEGGMSSCDDTPTLVLDGDAFVSCLLYSGGDPGDLAVQVTDSDDLVSNAACVGPD